MPTLGATRGRQARHPPVDRRVAIYLQRSEGRPERRPFGWDRRATRLGRPAWTSTARVGLPRTRDASAGRDKSSLVQEPAGDSLTLIEREGPDHVALRDPEA